MLFSHKLINQLNRYLILHTTQDVTACLTSSYGVCHQRCSRMLPSVASQTDLGWSLTLAYPSSVSGKTINVYLDSTLESSRDISLSLRKEVLKNFWDTLYQTSPNSSLYTPLPNFVTTSAPFQYGLYSSFVGCFVYCIFGSARAVTIGPTAIMAMMTSEYGMDGNPDIATLMAFFTGIIILFAGIFQLGKINRAHCLVVRIIILSRVNSRWKRDKQARRTFLNSGKVNAYPVIPKRTSRKCVLIFFPFFLCCRFL